VTSSVTSAVVSSSAVSTATGVQAVGDAETAINTPSSSSATPTSSTSDAQVSFIARGGSTS
jgi:hypothetical protein